MKASIMYLGKDRLIFEGDTKYTKEETRELQLFFKYIRENKLEHKGISIPTALKYLYAYKFDHQKAFEGLKDYYVWRTTKLPKMLNPGILTLYEDDFFRIFGRDKYYRPILIVKPIRVLVNTVFFNERSVL